MNWKAIKRFNFTWAIPGGAWLEDSAGYVNWFCFDTIQKQLGRLWIDRQLARQGWMTGCWVDVEQPKERVTLNMDGSVTMEVR